MPLSTAYLRLLFLLSYSLWTLALCGQTTVSGTVSAAADNTPLIGVTVREQGEQGGTLTDLDGNFELTITGEEPKLTFTYIGMVPQTVPVNGRTRVDVQLKEASTDLTGVVVTGYRGAQEVKDLVGSYAEVGVEELAADRPVESIDQLLEGRVAGVRVQTVTGEPGLPIKVEIRGQSSLPSAGSGISASTQPLYVLDGVPLFDVLETNATNTVFGGGNSQVLNPLAFINPDDVLSITVLKDASATALYGADASNGVILITTKTGQKGKSQVNLSVNYGTGRPINEIIYLNTREYLELARETLFNDGENPENAGPSDVDTDWLDIVQQKPLNADVDLSMSGGVSGVTYRLSAGYSKFESVHKGNGLEQVNLNLNLTFPLNDRLTLNTRLSGAYQYKESLATFGAFTYVPNIAARNPDGSFNTAGTFADRPNPAALLEQNENYHNSSNFNGAFTLTYKPISSLTIRGLAGLDNQGRNQFQYLSGLNASAARRGGRFVLSDNRNLQWISNAQAIWSPKTASRSHPSTLLGGEAQRQRQYRQLTTAVDFPFDDLRRLSAVTSDNISAADSRFTRAKLSSYAEIAYDYDYRYYFKLNARRDASSIFGGDQQAELFYAVGTAWNFSEEPYLAKRLPFGLNFGKLRGGYGVTGNSRLGVYTTGGVYQQQFADENYGGQLPATVFLPANDLLSWERKRQLNFALELGWPGDRIGLTLEYYSNRTIDGLSSFDTPRESGFTTILANTVSLRNYGYEMTFRYRTPKDRDLRYSSSFNISRNRNRLLGISREEIPRSSTASSAYVVGRDINLIYGIPFVDVDPESGEARYRLPDGSLTTTRAEIINPDNYVPIGTRVPDFYGGWHHQLSYGAFSLTFQLNYSYGGDEQVDRLTFTDGQQILFNNQSVNQLDRWQRPGDVTDVPRLSIDNAPVSRSSRYVFPNNYIQFSTLSTSVDLQKIGFLPKSFRSASFFALINNLGYLYDEDRRENRNGVREYRFTFPQQRTLTLGLKMGW